MAGQLKVGVNTLFHIPGEVGGSETYLIETLRALVKIGGIEWVLFASRANAAMLENLFGTQSHVCVVTLPFDASSRPARILAEQFLLPARIRDSGVLVLWSPGYTPVLRCPCPQVLTILDMQYKTHPEDLSCMARMVTDFLVQRGARSARRILAISEFGKSEIVRHTSAPPEKIDVTPLAADPAFAVPIDPQVLRKHFPTLGKPYLLAVANTYPHKNIHLVVEAFRLLEQELPHQLVLVGKPRLGEIAVQKALLQLRDPGRVLRLEGVSRSDLIALYQGSAAFVFPSAYEGFGLPVLEAMLAGVPVITSGKTALAEVAGSAGFIPGELSAKEIADSIRTAIALPSSSRAAQISKAREHAAVFSWEATAEKTIASLRRAAD